jgi:RNA polymerase sigma factor (sigma-70 family)
LATIFGHLRETALAGAPDADLLRHFNGGGSAAEAAFTLLVRRHGSAVLRACRAALHNPHDAEDAVQATFLVLATKARSLSPQTSLGPWLVEAARRVSAHARVAAARRRAHELKAAEARPETRGASPHEPDLAALVLDAVGRLQERYRIPLVLCDLEGLTYQAAAEQLGLSHGAVRNRLARGRQRLRAALRRMGVAPAVAVLAHGVAVPVPRALASSTARAAVLVAAGAADGAVPASVLVLIKGGLLMSKLKTASLSALAAIVLIGGAVGLSAQAPAPAPAPAVQNRSPEEVASQLDRTYVEAVSDYYTVKSSDPTARIVQLAQEARRLQEAGDVKGARQALRRLHTAAFDWEDALANGKPNTRPAPKPAAAPAPAPSLYSYRRSSNLGSTPTPAPAGGAKDVESRLQEVERKLDRLLKAMEERAGPRPGIGPSHN